MKRSYVNETISEAIALFYKHGWHLPPFAFFTPEEWRMKGRDYNPVRRCMLGWDMTDFGSGDFEKIGLFLFTLRNGVEGSAADPKTYAEKLMVVRVNQKTPFHFHWKKTEDIINRGGGVLKLRFFSCDENDAINDKPINLLTDGRDITLMPGAVITLKPGESVTIPTRVYHEFWAENDTAVVGEVSQVNDDKTDNRFLEPAGRFQTIEEDEPAKYLLCNEYPQAY
ncbi:MAG TPA: D-lyxose/D-mannose family sugar isomerase [Candidatus Limiplasma sp.]|nr:D-lyxose/D-mannose family sugar isomerase [Candidatus Limiplasma sp.]